MTSRKKNWGRAMKENASLKTRASHNYEEGYLSTGHGEGVRSLKISPTSLSKRRRELQAFGRRVVRKKKPPRHGVSLLPSGTIIRERRKRTKCFGRRRLNGN